MKRNLLILTSIVCLSPSFLLGCGTAETTPSTPNESDVSAETTAQAPASEEGEGTLVLTANGEDFVRQGFVSKDGWQIEFDHVYVTLTDVKAYQTNPPFNPDRTAELKASETIELTQQPQTIDLAQGDDAADPVEVAQTTAPAGRYNALTWTMTPAPEGPAQGQVLVMQGTAEKDGRTINFVIQSDQEYAYTCGEFVGDQRKGILETGDTADLEATFHFDHIFGDAEAAPDDDINTGAVGFEPFAALADGDRVEVDLATLRSELSPEDYATLEEALRGLAHVGEGHCREEETTA